MAQRISPRHDRILCCSGDQTYRTVRIQNKGQPLLVFLQLLFIYSHALKTIISSAGIYAVLVHIWHYCRAFLNDSSTFQMFHRKVPRNFRYSDNLAKTGRESNDTI